MAALNVCLLAGILAFSAGPMLAQSQSPDQQQEKNSDRGADKAHQPKADSLSPKRRPVRIPSRKRTEVLRTASIKSTKTTLDRRTGRLIRNPPRALSHKTLRPRAAELGFRHQWPVSFI